MNKKLIIGIIAGVVALAVIIFAIFALTTDMFSNKKENGTSGSGNTSISSSGSSSATGSTGSGSSSGSNASGSSSAAQSASSATVIEKGGITIGSVSGKPGSTVTVPVKIKDNPGIMAYLLRFKYDTSVLEYSEYRKGDFLNDYEVSDSNGVVSFINLEDNDVDTDGTIINLVFKIKSDAKSGKYDITLTSDISNYNEETISPKITNGSVTVK